MVMISPVIKELSFDARKIANGVISSGLPALASGICAQRLFQEAEP